MCALCLGDADVCRCLSATSSNFIFVAFLTSLYHCTFPSQGREASFSALAAAPLFAAKVPVGLLSGYLVHTYLPEDGSRQDGQTMWLIIGLLTL